VGNRIVATGIEQTSSYPHAIKVFEQRREIAQVAANGNTIAAVGDHLWVWELGETRGVEPRYTVPKGDYIGVAFSPHGSQLAAVQGFYLPSTVALFDVANGDLQAAFTRTIPFISGGGGGGLPPAQPVMYSPDGSKIAFANHGNLFVTFDVPPIPSQPTPQNVIAYCDQLEQSPALRADQSVNLIWSWYAREIGDVLNHTNTATYDLTLNGTQLTTFDNQPGAIHRDPVNGNDWTTYYVEPLGILSPGEYTVQYRVSWSTAISDGYNDFGPGTNTPEETSTCTFTVE
jgi:hypothetical protein